MCRYLICSYLPRYSQRRARSFIPLWNHQNIAVVLSASSIWWSARFDGTGPSAVLTLLPVDLILQVSSGAGFAMVFALLVAAILWNLGTWWAWAAGLQFAYHGRLDYRRGRRQPVCSAYTPGRTSGVDWRAGHQGSQGPPDFAVGGFLCAGILLLVFKGLTDTDEPEPGPPL